MRDGSPRSPYGHGRYRSNSGVSTSRIQKAPPLAQRALASIGCRPRGTGKRFIRNLPLVHQGRGRKKSDARQRCSSVGADHPTDP